MTSAAGCAILRARPAEPSDQESSRWRGAALCLLLLVGLSCGGGAGTPAAPGGPAQPPVVPTPPPPPPLPPEIGTPCPGVVVRGDPPREEEAVSRATLLIDWEQQSGGGFDWAGPYHDDEDDPEDRNRTPLLEVNVAEWRVETIEALRGTRWRSNGRPSGRSRGCISAPMPGIVSFQRSCAWRSGAN